MKLNDCRSLQLSGYFSVKKPKVPLELDSKEKMIGGLIVELMMRLQFNTHSITEASDAIPSKKSIMNGEFDNRTRYVSNM